MCWIISQVCKYLIYSGFISHLSQPIQAAAKWPFACMGWRCLPNGSAATSADAFVLTQPFMLMCHVDSMGGRDKKSLFCCSQTIIAHPLQTSGTLFGWRMSGSLQQNFCKYNGCHVSAQRLAFFRSATAGLGVTFRSKRTCAAGPANMWKFFLKCFCTGMMMNPQGEKDGSQKAS